MHEPQQCQFSLGCFAGYNTQFALPLSISGPQRRRDRALKFCKPMIFDLLIFCSAESSSVVSENIDCCHPTQYHQVATLYNIRARLSMRVLVIVPAVLIGSPLLGRDACLRNSILRQRHSLCRANIGALWASSASGVLRRHCVDAWVLV
ncbi:hypothetical protein PILCRDRAFT_660701 [Piloderma croceum F 1598]|uniref:Uncharacterized protein n=1 Tax=Piloderma croceum (strain F 1598) TaxID=765440 RepID=A0A0C3APW5_PILCF|nr:hypothetical protein PILCRDRAFT_660701 [Piloderma croceum F 1598]